MLRPEPHVVEKQGPICQRYMFRAGSLASTEHRILRFCISRPTRKGTAPWLALKRCNTAHLADPFLPPWSPALPIHKPAKFPPQRRSTSALTRWNTGPLHQLCRCVCEWATLSPTPAFCDSDGLTGLGMIERLACVHAQVTAFLQRFHMLEW